MNKNTPRENILVKSFDTPFETVPFGKIEVADFIPALKISIESAKENIERIKKNSAPPDLQNTLLALEFADEQVQLISSVFFNLHSAECTEELQNISQEFSRILTEFQNDISLDLELFQKIKLVFEIHREAPQKTGAAPISQEQKTLLEKVYKGFVRGEALLLEKDKERLRFIDRELSRLTLVFSENVLKDTNDFFLLLQNPEDFNGLPQSYIDQCQEMAAEKRKKGTGKSENIEGKNEWAITLDYPSYLPYMNFGQNREIREKLYRAFMSRGHRGGETENAKILQEIVKLRTERAKLLGYSGHAHYVLEERMAKTPNEVMKFLRDFLNQALPAAKKEFSELQDFAKTPLKQWDVNFWFEKLKKSRFNFDTEVLRPYFQLEKTVRGIFKVAENLYDIIFQEIPPGSVEVYHPDVHVYEVKDNISGRHLGIFYADFFPRPGKRSGAWMTQFRGQKGKKRPHISIVCNFTRPNLQTGESSLLTFEEVQTLFHEFGHALHGLLSDVSFESLSGTNVFWDFVEFPSQIMENWTFEKECLDLFASHYQTGEKIPADLLAALKASANFHEARATVRQVSLAMIDMAFHVDGKILQENIEEFEKSVIPSEAQFLPPIEGTCISTSFSHIFAGGYSSGYYSYKWAEVLEADAFEFFKEKGIFNKEVAKSFRENILSQGGTKHPMDLYVAFRGRKPKTEALLKRAGLV